MSAEQDAYHEVCAYTLTRMDEAFIHQVVVDTFAAQRADERTKPIALTFALIGLYLHVEEGVPGRQVQRIHMQLARRKWTWPTWTLPAERGEMTAIDVLAATPGEERDRAIEAWCASVWSAYRANRDGNIDLLKAHGIQLRDATRLP